MREITGRGRSAVVRGRWISVPPRPPRGSTLPRARYTMAKPHTDQMIEVFQGTIVHCLKVDSIQILKDHVIGVNQPNGEVHVCIAFYCNTHLTLALSYTME